MDSLRLFLLNQGTPVEYELDKFNTPHTGTTLFHPQNWLCRLQCLIPLWHLATTSPLGNIFWRHSRFSPKQPETQIHGDSKVYFPQRQICYILQTYLPCTSNNTRWYLNSLITPFCLFTSFFSYEACSTKANSLFHAAIKKTIIKTFRHLGISLCYLPFTLSEEVT